MTKDMKKARQELEGLGFRWGKFSREAVAWVREALRTRRYLSDGPDGPVRACALVWDFNALFPGELRTARQIETLIRRLAKKSSSLRTTAAWVDVAAAVHQVTLRQDPDWALDGENQAVPAPKADDPYLGVVFGKTALPSDPAPRVANLRTALDAEEERIKNSEEEARDRISALEVEVDAQKRRLAGLADFRRRCRLAIEGLDGVAPAVEGE